MAANIENLAIIGGGFMGSQIAMYMARHDVPVWIVDTSDEVRTRLKKHYESDLVLSRIHLTPDLEEGVRSADLIIESVPEDLQIKKKIFSRLDLVCLPQSILATSSSAVRASEIEGATSRPDKVVNTHFYPPVSQRPIVELMKGTVTSDETIRRVTEFFTNVQLIPLLVQKESTGFIFNRVWRSLKKEVLTIIADGVASFEDVDRAWMVATGMSIGPFGLMDMVGLDVIRDVERMYAKDTGDPKDLPPEFLLKMIENGELGIKSGKGFYTYPNPVFQDPLWLRKGNKK